MEVILFLVGGRLYTWIEIIWRGWTHWTMFYMGGGCFVIMGILNEHILPWRMPLLWQAMISACIITMLEFIVGCIINLWLGWQVWDYSDLPFNLLGQICLYYFLLWIPISAAGIILDDWIRYLFYRCFHKFFPKLQARERPHYKLIVGGIKN